MGAASRVRNNAASARYYKLLLANSGFTRSFMSFLYGIPFSEVIYPPVDPAVFFPNRSGSPDSFVLAVARNASEQNLALIQQLALTVPLKVVGGAIVPNAQCQGIVPDGDMSRMYSDAKFVVVPQVSEFFGYSVAEALSCGTPVLTLGSTGPSEQVNDGNCGWVVQTENQFLRVARRMFVEGYSSEMRESAVKRATVFSMDSVGRRLLEILDSTPQRDPDRSEAR